MQGAPYTIAHVDNTTVFSFYDDDPSDGRLMGIVGISRKHWGGYFATRNADGRKGCHMDYFMTYREAKAFAVS